MPGGKLKFSKPIIGVTGAIGSGKSTVLRLLAGFETPTAGDIHIDGQSVVRQRPNQRRIGMVFQKPNPFPKSIYENVAYGPRIHGLTRD